MDGLPLDEPLVPLLLLDFIEGKISSVMGSVWG